MRKLLLWIGLSLVALPLLAAPAAAQGECAGTSGSATINASAWTASCVFAITASDCVDSLGSSYECFEILATSATDPVYQSIALFLDAPPVQGMTYALGGTSTNGGMILGSAGFFLTAEAPYTGQVQVTRYDAVGGFIDCNFSFDARNLFGPGTATLTNGLFSGRLVRVAPSTWSSLKNLYR